MGGREEAYHPSLYLLPQLLCQPCGCVPGSMHISEDSGPSEQPGFPEDITTQESVTIARHARPASGLSSHTGRTTRPARLSVSARPLTTKASAFALKSTPACSRSLNSEFASQLWSYRCASNGLGCFRVLRLAALGIHHKHPSGLVWLLRSLPPTSYCCLCSCLGADQIFHI